MGVRLLGVHLERLVEVNDLVDKVKQEISYRAKSAGMEFESSELISGTLANAEVVFLRSIKERQLDDEGRPVLTDSGNPTYENKPLIWIEFGAEPFQQRIVTLCPWLVGIVYHDGRVQLGPQMLVMERPS